MHNTNHLISMRKDLETYLQSDNQDTKIELGVYDSMLRARLNYEERLGADLNGILQVTQQQVPDAQNYKVRSDLLSWLHTYGHAPAYIFVLEFDPTDLQHTEHVFAGNHTRIQKNLTIYDTQIYQEIGKIAYEDNAILLLSSGVVHATNAQLINVGLPTMQENCDIHRKYGFAHPVHTRHYSSLGASVHMSGTTVYTLGESGHIRRFKEGKITFSSVSQEYHT